MRISRLLSPSSFEYYTISSLQRYIQNKEGFVAIENLDRFINVKVLYLENNCISKIEGLSKLKFLTCLYLHNNFISDIENLDECTELHTLNLASNKIKKIQNLGRLKKLENLYLDKNLIENYDSICDILECPSITVVKLFVT
jgi:Leucine-rich repeat (LRR) protein